MTILILAAWIWISISSTNYAITTNSIFGIFPFSNEALAIPSGHFGAEDQGGGIAVADLNNNGKPDLIVFNIDNPTGENHGYYRIGWDSSTFGGISSWTDENLIFGQKGIQQPQNNLWCLATDIIGNVKYIPNPIAIVGGISSTIHDYTCTK